MMKNVLKIFMIVFIFVLLTVSATASDLPVKDVMIRAHDILILTTSGDVFQTENDITSQNKTLMLKEIRSLGDGDFLIKNNGDIYNIQNEQIYKGTNASEIINANLKGYYNNDGWGAHYSIITYIDTDNHLNFCVYDDNGNSSVISTEKYVKKAFGSNPMFVLEKNEELYLYNFDDSYFSRNEYQSFEEMSKEDILGKFEVKFIASDVIDVAYGSYNHEYIILKNNGDLLSMNTNKGTTEIFKNNINTFLGLTEDYYQYHRPAFADKNGTLYHYELGNLSQFDTGLSLKEFTVNAVDSHAKFVYIDDNGILYQCKLMSGGYKSENNFCLSKDIKFKKLYGDGLFALSDNNELYILYYSQSRNGKAAPDFLYKLSDVSIPVKIIRKKRDGLSYNNDFLIVDINGNCWGISQGKYVPFLTSFCQKNIKILFENKNIELTQKIQNLNGRTMYPFRECLENMGVSVIWDEKNQIAIGEIPSKKIEFPIGRSEYYVNGIRYEMDTKSYIDESVGRTYIPIRYAAEGLGFKVDWIEGDLENTISIHK